MTEIHIRISIAHEHLASLPPGETRARNALIVLDRFTRGEATHHQLVHAGDACRRGFTTYARQAKSERNPATRARVKRWCVAMFAVYDVIDRVAEDRTMKVPRPSLVLRLFQILAGWVRNPPALPRHPDTATPYRMGRGAA